MMASAKSLCVVCSVVVLAVVVAFFRAEVEVLVRAGTVAQRFVSPHNHHHTVVQLDPLIDDRAGAQDAATLTADDMVKFAEDFGSFGTYSMEKANLTRFSYFAGRFDVGMQYIGYGGWQAKRETYHKLRTRTNYYRETYAYGDRVAAPGVEQFLHYDKLIDAAHQVYGDCGILDPYIVFANILVPGQELSTHVDVPEFLGANRRNTHQWLLVAMQQSGLFERYRRRIVTGVSWYHSMAGGGAFAFYPEGANSTANVHNVRFNTAVVLDTDTVFHGVQQVRREGDDGSVVLTRPDDRIHYLGNKRWELRRSNGETVAQYDWHDMRYSVSWKAYCYKDEAERSRYAGDEASQDADVLTLDKILDTFIADLRKRGRIGSVVPRDPVLATLIVLDYIQFPPVPGGLNYCLVWPLSGLCGDLWDTPFSSPPQ